jgi:three-Cys-motif partner protein
MEANVSSLFDEIGWWSEIKLEIVRDYATEYSKIMSAQRNPNLDHGYIDAFAGAGQHISKTTGEMVPGSPANALLVQPPFRDYHFIDIQSSRVDELQRLARERPEVNVYPGDCNEILLTEVFPRFQWEKYRRALCLLDPYGLHLDWKVIEAAGRMKSIEVFLNFPVADMNRNALRKDPKGVSPEQAARMTRFWGNDSWRQVAYSTVGNLFGWEEKTDNDTIAAAFRDRLMQVAGFQYVAEPLAFKNSRDAKIYYLFFASNKPVAQGIVQHIFNKYRDRL